MEEYGGEEHGGQQRLIPPETALEHTMRTGTIDFMGLSMLESIPAMRERMPEIVTLFDDVIERPEHYYDESKNIMPAASSLGSLMVRKAVRVLGEGTIDDVQAIRETIWPSFYKHLLRSIDQDDRLAQYSRHVIATVSDEITYDLQKGLEEQRTAYKLLMDTRKIMGSGYEFTILRSRNGLAAKALCMIVDAPDQTMMGSELDARLAEPEELKLLLDALIDLQVIRIDPFRSPNEYFDGVPSDRAYRPYQGWRCRTEEDTELMLLARYHAKKYDELCDKDQEAPQIQTTGARNSTD